MSSAKNPTRDRILKATWKLLESGEGSAVRMSDIAKAAQISRQALYLHFPNRAELLIATTKYLDEVYDVQARLAPTRAAKTGQERLAVWIDVWGNYIPKIYGVAKALMAMQDSDEEARGAWADRMAAMREGCAAAVGALAKDGTLNPDIAEKDATDLLWTLLSVRNWELLRQECGWSQDSYITMVTQLAQSALVKR